MKGDGRFELKGKPETGKDAAVLDRFQVAGGSLGWLVAGDVAG